MLKHSSRISAPVSRTVGIGTVALASLVLIGCSNGSPSLDSPQNAQVSNTTWSYAGANGPEHWGEYGGACQNTEASQESPINIDSRQIAADAAEADAAPISFSYAAADFELENNGHTIEAIPTDLHANSVERNGVTYELQQFHFHASSEHTFNGTSTAAELHLVHQSADGELLVIGVLLEVGDANPALDELFDSITDEVSGDEGEALSTPINPADLLPADLTSVQYSGSLTTPPCSEGVQWNVFPEPVTVSANQLAKYTDVYPDNHRPVQPLHDRELFVVAPAA